MSEICCTFAAQLKKKEKKNNVNVLFDIFLRIIYIEKKNETRSLTTKNKQI